MIVLYISLPNVRWLIQYIFYFPSLPAPGMLFGAAVCDFNWLACRAEYWTCNIADSLLDLVSSEFLLGLLFFLFFFLDYADGVGDTRSTWLLLFCDKRWMRPPLCIHHDLLCTYWLKINAPGFL